MDGGRSPAAEDTVHRRFTVVVSADVVAYARLIWDDKTGTRAALRSHRAELIDPRTKEHQGRIVGTAGDSLLVEFTSVVDATQIAGHGTNTRPSRLRRRRASGSVR